MDGRDWRVQLARGSATVARHGGVVVLAEPGGDAQQDFVDRVLEACRAAAVEHADAPGRRLVRKVASLVSQADVDDVPGFGLLASLGNDVAALLVGDVDLEISGADGKEVLSGRDVSTWVDRIVRAPFDTLDLHVGSAGEVDARSDLGEGTVTAGGVLVRADGSSPAPASSAPAPAPARTIPPEPAPERAPAAEQTQAAAVPEAELPAPDAPLNLATPVPAQKPENAPKVSSGRSTFQTFALTEPPEEPAQPLPVAETADDGDQPQVQGIMCSRRHFNDPKAVYCSSCGISMVHQTHNLVSGKRPSLGVLVFDDGSVVPLSQDYVIGREPEAAPQVTDGSAQALQLDDPDLKVSRVHARLQLKDWDVRVVDAGSANGTFVLKKDQTEWTRLVAEEPVTITPGTRVAMGGRTMEFESHHKA